VLLVGLTYKRNSGDARQSPAAVVAHRLADLGAELHGVDPLVASADVPAGVQLVECVPEVVEAADIVIVLTDHDAIDWDLLSRYGEKVLDTRNRLAAPGVDRL
jgi:UDP-N-acetyl-D-glucosamine dehydrogenase